MFKMANILINEKLKESQLKTIAELLPEYEILTELETDKLRNTEVIVNWSKKMTELWEEGKFPNLKWVQATSAGVSYLPLKKFQEKGIVLTNASGIHKYTITEHIIGVLLSYLRDFDQLKENQEKKHWTNEVRVEQLYGKTILIYGIGSIGRQLARVCQSFGMHVIGVNTSGDAVDEADETLSQENSDTRIQDADIIVNILPETQETIGFFNHQRFQKMKAQTVFVNVGRGSAVDTEALIEALDNDIIAFAALDVFETEPLDADSPLWEHDKVFISPHSSGKVEHFRDALFTVVEPNVRAYAKNGKPSLNVIDYDKSY